MTADARLPWPGRRFLLNTAWALLASDAALTALHLGTGRALFDLDREGNLATWYSSTKLLGIALLSLAVAAAMPPRAGGRRLWVANGAVFVALSADESASMHESFARWVLELPGLAGLRATLTGGDEVKASYAWVWLFLPLIIGAAVFLVLLARSLRGRARLLFAAGLVMMLGAVALEALVFRFPPVAEWGAAEAMRYVRLTTAEESLELLGTSLLFAATCLQLVRLQSDSATRGE